MSRFMRETRSELHLPPYELQKGERSLRPWMEFTPRSRGRLPGAPPESAARCVHDTFARRERSEVHTVRPFAIGFWNGKLKVPVKAEADQAAVRIVLLFQRP